MNECMYSTYVCSVCMCVCTCVGVFVCVYVLCMNMGHCYLPVVGPENLKIGHCAVQIFSDRYCNLKFF